MSSVELTPFDVRLKTQNIKMCFYCCNSDPEHNFKEKTNNQKKTPHTNN